MKDVEFVCFVDSFDHYNFCINFRVSFENAKNCFQKSVKQLLVCDETCRYKFCIRQIH